MRNWVAAAMTLALLGSVATTAQADDRPPRIEQRDQHRDHDRYKSRDDRHDHDRDHRHDGRSRDRHDHKRQDDKRHEHGRYDRDRYGHQHHGHYVKPPGYRYRAWRHGEYLPRTYRSTRYIVNDYRAYRLRQPPRGYHWVRVDKDVVLAAIATGLVAKAIYGAF